MADALSPGHALNCGSGPGSAGHEDRHGFRILGRVRVELPGRALTCGGGPGPAGHEGRHSVKVLHHLAPVRVLLPHLLLALADLLAELEGLCRLSRHTREPLMLYKTGP